MESKTYYIYHIPNYVRRNGRIGKIGCAADPATRVARQGYTDYTILEEHSCIYEASKRERELQKEWGYPVDRIPYYETVQKSSAGGKAGGKISGKINGRMNVESGHLARLRTTKHQSKAGKAGGKVTAAIKVQCPYCDKISTPGGIGSHKRKCKQKPQC